MNRTTRRLVFVITFVVSTVMLSSCGEDFLSRKPKDSISLSNFYSSTEQVKASTNILYGAPWFGFNTKFMWDVGEMYAGNGRSFSADAQAYVNFSITGDNSQILSGWQSLWGVVGQSNALINNLPKRVSGNVDQSTVDAALGEAHVMRALAYFYLVRLWGPVMIIKNNLNYVYSPQVPRNRVQDVYQFIINDLQYGIDHCANVSSGLYGGGHVTSGSAKALLSKIYLTRGNYQKAEQLSQEVINSGEFHLIDNYANLFKVQHNNNPETIIALQWTGSGSYGQGNGIQASWAYETKLTGTGGGYAVLGPTISLQNAYTSGDQRRKPTIMLGGDHYSYLLSGQGGYTVPNDVNAQGSDAAAKKYVVGTPEDQGGVGSSYTSAINTYMLRYADVLLIHAEAIVQQNGGSTSSQPALDSFNKVRERAGLSDKSSITEDDIIHARRLEFALESKYWYTLRRIDRQKAINMISNQERGQFAMAPRQDPPTIYSEMYTPTEDDFTLPYPAEDVERNKYLQNDHPPQEYDFNNDNSNSNSNNSSQ